MAVSNCPLCNHAVDPQFRYCQNCGIDLALATTMAEEAISSTTQGEKPPISPEILVPRLGENLVKQKIITEEQLAKALEYQKQQMQQGKRLLLGESLVELGIINRATLDQAITSQILQLQTALNRANRNLEKRVRERTAELRRAVVKLSDLHQLKANFISNISHELRTPLTHIKGYLELMAENDLGPLTKEQKEAVSVMARSTEQLEKLINDLIQFSETTKSGLRLHLEPVAVQNVIHKVIQKLQGKAEKQGVTLITGNIQELPDVMADVEKITWVLSQLIDNAIKFTPSGGKVTILGQHNEDRVTVAVIDTGIGMPADRIEEIFIPFHQLDNSPTRRYGGTGMGLALVKRVLEAHHTSIQVKSSPGKGSNFYFSLPVAAHSQRSRHSVKSLA